MKKIFFLIFFLSFCEMFMAQKEEKAIRVIYELKYQPNKKDTLKNTEEMVLFLSKSKSIFQSYIMYQRDSILLNEKSKGISPMIIYAKLKTFPKPKFNYIIEKSFDNEKYYIMDKVFTDQYKYTENMVKFDWKITNDILKLDNLICKKATTKFAGRDYIAWYVEDIPIPDGPYKFYGLPGLIVRISDTQNQFDFSLKSINEIPEIKMHKVDNKVIETTKDKFLQANKLFQENAINNLRNRGLFFDNENEVNKILKDKFKRNNNPIEIE